MNPIFEIVNDILTNKISSKTKELILQLSKEEQEYEFIKVIKYVEPAYLETKDCQQIALMELTNFIKNVFNKMRG